MSSLLPDDYMPSAGYEHSMLDAPLPEGAFDDHALGFYDHGHAHVHDEWYVYNSPLIPAPHNSAERRQSQVKSSSPVLSALSVSAVDPLPGSCHDLALFFGSI